MVLCMGVQTSIVPESFSWLNCFTAFIRRRELIPPISIDRVAKAESHTCGFQSCLLSLSWALEKEAQSEGWKRWNTPEAGVKSQHQRRVGKNHVWSNRQSRVNWRWFHCTTMGTRWLISRQPDTRKPRKNWGCLIHGCHFAHVNMGMTWTCSPYWVNKTHSLNPTLEYHGSLARTKE